MELLSFAAEQEARQARALSAAALPAQQQEQPLTLSNTPTETILNRALDIRRKVAVREQRG